MKFQTRQAVADRPAPFSVLDLDAALYNAQDMLTRVRSSGNGVSIRVASKSIRIRALLESILKIPGYKGVLSYHLNEALWLVDEEVSDDILVAYPCANPEAIAQWQSEERYRRAITLMVDSIEHLDFLDKYVKAPVRLCIDVDASLKYPGLHIGALRSPAHSVQAVVELAQEITKRHNFQLVGLMAYEGQIAGTTDTSPAISMMKRVSAAELKHRRRKIVRAVEKIAPLEFVNGGGTGSIETTAAEGVITEIGAGSGIIGSGLFDHYKHFSPTPAQWFVLPVVRRPNDKTVTVAGGGRIASGPVGKDRQPVVDYPSGLKLVPLEGAGEVQTPLRGPGAAGLQLGDHVWMRHAKAGEQAEWTNSVLVVSNGNLIDEWLTYRGEGRSFV